MENEKHSSFNLTSFFKEEVREDDIYLKFGHLKNFDFFFDRQKDQQTDRQTHRPRDRQTDQQTDRRTDRQTLCFIGKLYFQKDYGNAIFVLHI